MERSGNEEIGYDADFTDLVFTGGDAYGTFVSVFVYAGYCFAMRCHHICRQVWATRVLHGSLRRTTGDFRTYWFALFYNNLNLALFSQEYV